MTVVLKLPITLDNGKTLTYSLPDPKGGLTKTEADTAMDYIVNENTIIYDGAQAVGHETGYLYKTEKELLTD